MYTTSQLRTDVTGAWSSMACQHCGLSEGARKSTAAVFRSFITASIGTGIGACSSVRIGLSAPSCSVRACCATDLLHDLERRTKVSITTPCASSLLGGSWKDTTLPKYTTPSKAPAAVEVCMGKRRPSRSDAPAGDLEPLTREPIRVWNSPR